MELLALILLTGSALGAALFFKKQHNHKEEVVDDYEAYKLFLEAAAQYREKHGQYAKHLEGLVIEKPELEGFPLRRYALSLDGKFLIVKFLDQKTSEHLINQIGGDSYLNGQLTYLTLLRKKEPSDILPIAHFSLKPDGVLTTTTPITYDTSQCVAVDGEILEQKWENKRIVFPEPGLFNITLKIRDKNGNWSDTFQKEIKVVEESGIREIVSYDQSHFLIYNSGKVLCRGKNEFGQLGLGTLNPVAEWHYSSLHDGVMEVALGEGFSIFRLFDGSVFSAGNNRHGELASGDKNTQKSLTSVWGLDHIKQVCAGKAFAAALDLNGNVYVWGDNSENQLMQADYTDAVSPVRLQGLEGIKQIACGSNFGLALKYDGTVIGWGDNTYGQLAVGYKGSIDEPVITQYKNVSSVHAGDRFSLVVTDSGRVYGAGNNAFGQLASKGKSEVLFPEEVFKIKDVQTLRVRESLALAITKTGKAYVWGNFNTPAQKPIQEPTELVGISYVKAYTNNGKKLYIVDGADQLYVVSDLSGKYEQTKVAANFHDFNEKKG